jgi:hypothetical protein
MRGSPAGSTRRGRTFVADLAHTSEAEEQAAIDSAA